MTEKEIGAQLEEMRANLRLFDTIVDRDYKTGEGRISEKQADLVSKLLELFQALSWQIPFNSYKELKTDGSHAVKTDGFMPCGTPVKVRSCRPEHGSKTYFGILIGDVAQSITHHIDEQGNVTTSHSYYNPAIFVPELKDIVYGCESWWGEIKSEEELGKLITDDTIKNVWYVKVLAALSGEKG